MYRLQFFKNNKECLKLELNEESGSVPRFISGDVSWFDYSQTVYSSNLNREIRANENPQEWVKSLVNFYHKDQEVNLMVTEIDSPPVPEETAPLNNDYFYTELIKTNSPKINQNKDLSDFNGMVLSGWWRRVGAFIIDHLIIGFIMVLITIVFLILLSLTVSESGEPTNSPGDLFLIIALVVSLLATPVIYYLATMTRDGIHNGQSLGKQLFDISVVRENGQRINFGFVLFRQFIVIGILFGTINSLTVGLSFALDSLWMLWDDKSQTLHDKVASSRVVSSNFRS